MSVPEPLEGRAYATLVGDIAGSRRYPDQKALFSAVRDEFAWVNARVPAVQPLEFTVGDEFQAAYASVRDALRAAILLRLRLRQPLQEERPQGQDVRIGLSFGEITRYDAEAAPFAQSGPGWWQARAAIEEAEALGGRKGAPRLQSRFAGGDASQRALVNALLAAVDQVLFRMDESDVTIALGTLAEKSQQEIGASLGVTQSTISKRYKDNGPATLLRVLRDLAGDPTA